MCRRCAKIAPAIRRNHERHGGAARLRERCYDGIEIHRAEKIIYVKFLVPHDVLSTCRAAGGFQTDMDYVFNHQSVEPVGTCTACTKARTAIRRSIAV
jgi:hypothetical protein